MVKMRMLFLRRAPGRLNSNFGLQPDVVCESVRSTPVHSSRYLQVPKCRAPQNILFIV